MSKIECIQTQEQLHIFLNKIDASKLSSPNKINPPSLTFHWKKIFFNTLAAHKNIFTTILYNEDKIPEFILFGQKKNNNQLQFLCDTATDYNDIIVSKQEMLNFEPIFDFWKANGINQIQLSRIPSTSSTLNWLERAAKRKAKKVTIWDCDIMPVVKIEKTNPIKLWCGVNKKRIIRFEKLYKKFHNLNNLTFEIITDFNQFQAFNAQIFQIHKEKWEKTNRYSSFGDEKLRMFANEICYTAALNKELFIPLLRVDNDIVAYRLCFKREGIIYDWVTGYNSNYEKWSPGMLLLLQMFEYFRTSYITKYNFLRGIEPYKYHWTKSNELTKSIKIIL